ncbi:hypothetical protein [uncultured Sphingomonas sp.]|uniref:hypothetical protein n=1 Tax=uncultured Sphingomonas sp. TaxID=158754 RepID=UPI0025CBA3D2|nr:hypothetical protein [uncultured Sphingomonas sp.]
MPRRKLNQRVEAERVSSIAVALDRRKLGMALFWLSGEVWASIKPHKSKNQPGVRRVNDRRVIAGILHVLTAPAVAGATARSRTGRLRRSATGSTEGGTEVSGLTYKKR